MNNASELTIDAELLFGCFPVLQATAPSARPRWPHEKDQRQRSNLPRRLANHRPMVLGLRVANAPSERKRRTPPHLQPKPRQGEMIMGRHPIPLEEKRKRGTLRQNRLPGTGLEEVPRLPIGEDIPAPPEHLGPRGREFWAKAFQGGNWALG